MIEIRALTKAYGDILALRGVDLRVSAGELCVVLGPSGAGKSTLLRCVNRLTEPTSGEILVAGKSAPRTRADLRALRQHIGMIFQDHNLVPRLSVLKNVLTGRLATMPSLAAALQVFPRADIDIALFALRRVDLAERANDRADRLSGGQQQRVGIARALAQRPKVILADEPVASLDPKTARVVLDDLRRAAHELGIAVLCNLHQVEYALEFADRIVGICDGQVVYEGTPAQLDEAALSRIYPGLDAEIARAPARATSCAREDRMSRFRFLLGGAWTFRRWLDVAGSTTGKRHSVGMEREGYRLERPGAAARPALDLGPRVAHAAAQLGILRPSNQAGDRNGADRAMGNAALGVAGAAAVLPGRQESESEPRGVPR